MNISGNSLAPIDTSEGAQSYTAALSKSQQKLEGQAALALIQAASTVTPAANSTSPLSSPNLGAHIDVWV